MQRDAVAREHFAAAPFDDVFCLHALFIPVTCETSKSVEMYCLPVLLLVRQKKSLMLPYCLFSWQFENLV